VQHAYGLNIPSGLDDLATPEGLALLVYDMQVGILSQLADPAPVVARVAEALEAARHAGVRVFFTRHLSLPRELMGAAQYRTAMAWQHVSSPDDVRPWFLRDAPGLQIAPELAPRPSEGVVDKITMSAFEGTYLDIALRDCAIQAVAVAGVALEIGIEPTVRHAADLGYVPVLLEDACGAGNHEAGQRSLESLRFAGDALIVSTEMFCDALA
jgi:nicotinamidase-related amidase